ncbi:hypothetical protein FN846DRAFT_820578 [Sphaerosporella brunnea]|uniref:Uncharacterized protein n=1 Tax=Sphaerosporella brunnea TaxID=1250544 RepID=A0A5J5EE12_9PEZI|nr:hypothetical protein FN846DRAFT_820578 [Sphaerosporella brunnea]
MNTYTITVKNDSGNQQDYALFNAAPTVINGVQKQIWSNVFATANTPPAQTAEFTVYDQYFAICGHSSGSPAGGVAVTVGQDLPVTLGVANPDGTLTPGTTLTLENSEGAPAFAAAIPSPQALANCFEIATQGDFNSKIATNDNWMIGLGGSSTGSGFTGPAATFVPEPSVHYQIQPVNTYFLTFGDYKAGNLIDRTKMANQVLLIDFDKLPNSVTVEHDAEGQLVIQK